MLPQLRHLQVLDVQERPGLHGLVRAVPVGPPQVRGAGRPHPRRCLRCVDAVRR